MTKIEKKEAPPKEAFEGRQLDLFRDFLCNTNQEREALSNTIELWDAIPKYQVSRRRQSTLRKEGVLPSYKCEFIHKKTTYTLRIRPARLSKFEVIDGVETEEDIEYYPSAREELVEDALRKIASEKKRLYLDKERSGVTFSIHMLRKELSKRGHTLSYNEIRESLFVLSGAGIELSDIGGKNVLVTRAITNLIQVNQDDIRKDPDAKWYADFSGLVTDCIKRIDYRQYDYDKMMHHKSQLSRWLNKRLSHNYLHADLLKPYVILLSTIKRDSGLLGAKRDVDNRRQMIKVLDELKNDKVLLHYEIGEIMEANKILDIKYKLVPNQEFVGQIKAANKRYLNHKEQIVER